MTSSDQETLGQLMDRIGGSVKTGPFGTKLKASEYTPTGVPVVSVGEVGHGRLQIHDDTPRVDESVTSRMPEYLLEAGDIVFGRKGAVDRSAQVQPSEHGYFLGSDGIRVRLPSSGCDPRFASYQLQTNAHKAWMLQHAAGSTMPSLNEGIIRRIPIVSKPLSEQKRIAHILGTLDDKIELNRRMNATLEAMARAVFQSWFVDFDPVRAKAAGQTPAGMDPATAALFPAEFEDSELGEIPKGWKVERFEQHLNGERGLSYNGEGLRDDGTGLPMHNLNSIYEGGGYKHEGLKFYGGEHRNKHLLNAGDMIITNTEQGHEHRLIGFAAIVPSCYGPTGLFSHHIYRIRVLPGSPLDAHYLVQLFNNRRWHKIIAGYSNGTSINMLPPDALKAPRLIVPPIVLVRKFSALAAAAHARIESNIAESRTLAALRDALLPKLLSGELQVGAALKGSEDVLAGVAASV